MHSIGEISGGVPAFLAKLWKLVEDPETDHLITWSSDGLSFAIQNQAQFARELLPLYYKHNNMASFIRQLNMYGFHKVTSIDNGGLKFDKDEIEFSHSCFLRGHSYLLEHIKRKVNVKTEHLGVTKIEEASQILTDMKIMKGRQESLDARFAAMKSENKALWREVAILRQKHHKQQQIVNKLIQFLVSVVTPGRSPHMGSMGMGVKRPYQLMLGDSPTSAKVKKSAEVSSKDGAGPTIHELTPETNITEEFLANVENDDHTYVLVPGSYEPTVQSPYSVDSMGGQPSPMAFEIHEATESPSPMYILPENEAELLDMVGEEINPVHLLKHNNTNAVFPEQPNAVTQQTNTVPQQPNIVPQNKRISQQSNVVPQHKIIVPPNIVPQQPKIVCKQSNTVPQQFKIEYQEPNIVPQLPKIVSKPSIVPPQRPTTAVSQQPNIVLQPQPIKHVFQQPNIVQQQLRPIPNTTTVPLNQAETLSSLYTNGNQNNEYSAVNNDLEVPAMLLQAEDTECDNIVDPMLGKGLSVDKGYSSDMSIIRSDDLSLAKLQNSTNRPSLDRLDSVEDMDLHLDNMQGELDSLRDLLKGEGYTLDANTLMGVCGGSRGLLNHTGALNADVLLKLFGSEDPMSYGLSMNPSDMFSDSYSEKDGEDAVPSGSELMAYQTPLLDLNDILDAASDDQSLSQLVNPDLLDELNTPPDTVQNTPRTSL